MIDIIEEESDIEVIIVQDDEDVVIEEEESDVEISIADSDYDSDCSENIDSCVRNLNQTDINDFTELTKMCNIFFYYKNKYGAKFCSTCFLRIANLYSSGRAVRKHETARYALIEGSICSYCGCSLNQIVSCRVCPVCIY